MTAFPKVSGDFEMTSAASPKRLATDVPGAVDYTGQSRAQIYVDLRAGLLAAYKNGARTIIFYDDLDRYMRALPRAKFKPVDDADDADAKLAAIAEDAPEAEAVEGEDETTDIGACLAAAKRQLAQLQQLILSVEAKTAPPK